MPNHLSAKSSVIALILEFESVIIQRHFLNLCGRARADLRQLNYTTLSTGLWPYKVNALVVLRFAFFLISTNLSVICRVNKANNALCQGSAKRIMHETL